MGGANIQLSRNLYRVISCQVWEHCKQLALSVSNLYYSLNLESHLVLCSYNVSDQTQVAEGLGVPHVVELFAIWGPGNLGKPAPPSYFTSNAAIIPVMQGYWTSFVRTMNPNYRRAPGTPIWEPFASGTGDQRILFMTNSTRMEVISTDQKTRCGYYSSISAQLQQ